MGWIAGLGKLGRSSPTLVNLDPYLGNGLMPKELLLTRRVDDAGQEPHGPQSLPPRREPAAPISLGASDMSTGDPGDAAERSSVTVRGSRAGNHHHLLIRPITVFCICWLDVLLPHRYKDNR